MAAAKPTTAERQVRRVRRRLFAQTFVDTLFWSWGGGLAVLGLWFVLQPLAWHEASAGVHWTVAGVVVGLATLMAFAWALRVLPSRVDAALALDERFALRERVTTWLLLEPKTASPVADALQADVEHHVGAIHVADRFPVRVRSRTLVAPAIGAALAVALFFLGPVVSDLLPAGDGRSVVQAREVQETLESLKKAVHKPRDDQPAGKEQKELDDALAKLLNRPLPESQQQIRERIQEMRRLEEKIQERLSSLQEQAQRGDRLKGQLEKLAQGQNKSAATDADAKDLEDALAKGAFDKAVDALDKLSKKLKDKGLSPKELEQLARQGKGFRIVCSGS